MAAKRIKLSVGDQVMIVGDDRTGEALRVARLYSRGVMGPHAGG